MYHVAGSSNSKGLIILLREKMGEGDVQVVFKRERILVLKMSFGNFNFYLMNLYAPNTKKEKILFFNEMYYVLDKLKSDDVFICGDFNMVYDNARDIISGQPHDEEVVKRFKNWIYNFNLVDTWRLQNSDDIDFTYSKPTPFVARRLDYIFTSEALSYTVEQSFHVINSSSDHKIVVTSISSNKFKRGKSYWKFNTSLLSDEKYLKEMNEHIDSFSRYK